MRKLRLREGNMEEYRLEMELKLGNEHRTVRDKWQPASAREVGTAVGADAYTTWGGGRQTRETAWTVSRAQLGAQCPLSCDLGAGLTHSEDQEFSM